MQNVATASICAVYYKVITVTFSPGESGNPGARPKGSKNVISREFHEVREEAKRRGYPHPYLQMAEWANDPNKPLEIRCAMLKECASYTCVKPKQSIAIESDVPIFQSETQAEQFLAEFISAMAPSLEPAEIASMTKQWIETKREGKELELKVASQGDPDKPQRIKIVGGLPRLPIRPGESSVIMPSENGLNGHVIDGLPAPAPGDQCKSNCNSVQPDNPGSVTAARTSDTTTAVTAAAANDGEP
jgi:hypothetical protein